MIPLVIEGANIIMKGPPNSEVVDLHVMKVDNCYVSRWEPTPAELDKLVAGGSVELWVVGGQPPVALTVREHAGE